MNLPKRPSRQKLVGNRARLELRSVFSCQVRAQLHGSRCLHPSGSQDHSLTLMELFSLKAHLFCPSTTYLFFSFFCFDIRSGLEIIHGERRVGTKNLRMKVDKLITHPYFDSWFLDNDIALLLLKSPFKLDATKVPICLSEVTDIDRWRNCWVTGWGITSELL